MADQPTPTNNTANVVRPITAPVLQDHGPGLAKFLAVGAASTLVNGTVLAVMFGIAVLMGFAINVDANEVKMTEATEVENSPPEFDLTNTDLGLDSSLPLNYNVDRIEEVSVPGRVDPTQSVGIVNAPEAAPTNVPPPPGAGLGTGGSIIDPTKDGTGAAFGTAGGYGGLSAPGGFGGRSGSTRQKMVTEGGGNAASEAAVARGLEWLALHQAGDGHWSLNGFNKHARTAPLPGGKVVGDNSTPQTTRSNDTAGTAFGLLPFLAAGITHKPTTQKKEKDYSKGVNLAIRWLINKQSKTGDTRGYFGGDMYSHGLATIAMCEAYGLSSDPVLKASAQMGLDYIVKAQDPAGGGWRYAPRQAGDTSVTGWQLMALKSGQMSGLTVPKQALEKVTKFLDSCETADKGTSTVAKGGYAYTPGGGATPTMTAVGGLCRQYLGVNPRNPSLLSTVRQIKQVPPDAGAGIYYEYYATQVMHHMGGEAWNFWNLGPKGDGKKGIRDVLIAKQAQDGGNKGSFAGSDHVGGRLGGTSLSLLTLEVYYRHLPLYRRDAGMAKPDDDK